MEDTELITVLASELAAAISLAEGGNVVGALPWRIHNPGDLELGDRGFGVEASKTIYAKADPEAPLDDRTDGYSALRRECTAILAGNSWEYTVTMTFVDLAKHWTGGDNPGAWAKIVCAKLEVDPLATLAEWIKTRQAQS